MERLDSTMEAELRLRGNRESSSCSNLDSLGAAEIERNGWFPCKFAVACSDAYKNQLNLAR